MRKCIWIFMMIVALFFVSGCMGIKQEIKKIAVVVATGFDISEEDKYRATVQILNPKKQSSSNIDTQSSRNQHSSKDIIVFSGIGETPNDALNNISKGLGKVLFFGHAKYVVIGKDLAEYGLSAFIDSALRGYQTRPDNILLVTKGKASNILNATTIDEKVAANSVESLIELQSARGFVPKVSRIDYANSLYSKTSAPILGVIDLNKDDNIGCTFSMEGTAVFKKDKLIGFMDMNATRGMQWIKGEVRDGNIVVRSLETNNKINFQIIKANSKVKAIKKGENVAIEITINENGNILEMQGELDPMKDYEIIADLNKLQDEAIERDAKLALYLAQKEYRADIFNFGGIIKRNYPEVWEKIEKEWENIFPNLEVDFKINSTLKRPGLISKPIE